MSVKLASATKGFVVRSRLKRVLKEAVKLKVTERMKEVKSFPDRYIDSVKYPDGHVLVIALLTLLISCFRSFAAILPFSPPRGG